MGGLNAYTNKIKGKSEWAKRKAQTEICNFNQRWLIVCRRQKRRDEWKASNQTWPNKRRIAQTSFRSLIYNWGNMWMMQEIFGIV